MADNPITTPLPADLPTNWVYGQTIGPQGTDVGLTQQHGYNYLMQQVNAAQQAATQIGQAFSGLPSLGSDGKIPASQLPAMNYDPAGSAAAVQTNLDAHINNKNNPHGVTASQVSTSEGGNVENSLSQKIDKITTLSPPTDLNSVLESGNYRLNGDSSGFTNGPSSGAGWGLMSVVGYSSNTVAQILYQLGNNVWTRVFQDGTTWSAWAKLATLDNSGVPRITTGSYVGTGTYGQASPTIINTGNTSKFLIVTADPPNFYAANSSLGWFFWFPGITQVNVYSSRADGDCAVSQSGATISWYNTEDAYYQLNRSGTTYRWISFG